MAVFTLNMKEILTYHTERVALKTSCSVKTESLSQEMGRGVWSCYLITYCELSVNVSHWLMCMDIQSPTLMVLFWDVIELLDMGSS